MPSIYPLRHTRLPRCQYPTSLPPIERRGHAGDDRLLGLENIMHLRHPGRLRTARRQAGEMGWIRTAGIKLKAEFQTIAKQLLEKG